jgi:hypothetical protein
LAIFNRLGPRRRRRGEEGLGEVGAQGIAGEGGWVGDDGGDFFVQARLIAADENKFGDKISGAACSFPERDAKA